MNSQWVIDIVLRPLGAVLLFGTATLIGKLVLWPMRDGPLKRRLTERLPPGKSWPWLFGIAALVMLYVIVSG